MGEWGAVMLALLQERAANEDMISLTPEKQCRRCQQRILTSSSLKPGWLIVRGNGSVWEDGSVQTYRQPPRFPSQDGLSSLPPLATMTFVLVHRELKKRLMIYLGLSLANTGHQLPKLILQEGTKRALLVLPGGSECKVSRGLTGGPGRQLQTHLLSGSQGLGLGIALTTSQALS